MKRCMFLTLTTALAADRSIPLPQRTAGVDCIGSACAHWSWPSPGARRVRASATTLAYAGRCGLGGSLMPDPVGGTPPNAGDIDDDPDAALGG